MIHLPEILIVLAIVAIVFGFGKLNTIGKSVGKAGKDFKDGLKEGMSTKEDGPIDITPEALASETPSDPKPGTRKQPVEDAEYEPTT